MRLAYYGYLIYPIYLRNKGAKIYNISVDWSVGRKFDWVFAEEMVIL